MSLVMQTLATVNFNRAVLQVNIIHGDCKYVYRAIESYSVRQSEMGTIKPKGILLQITNIFSSNVPNEKSENIYLIKIQVICHLKIQKYIQNLKHYFRHLADAILRSNFVQH